MFNLDSINLFNFCNLIAKIFLLKSLLRNCILLLYLLVLLFIAYKLLVEL